MPEVSWLALLPSLIVSVTAMLVLVIDLWVTGPDREGLGWIGIVGVSAAFVVAMFLYFHFLARLGMPIMRATETIAQAGWPAWTGFVLISVMPAIFEELAFRGVIQSSLERVFNVRDAWLIQAALFSLLHLSPLVFPSHFAMGLAFGWIRMRSRSLYPAMLLHGAWNALVVFQELAQ